MAISSLKSFLKQRRQNLHGSDELLAAAKNTVWLSIGQK